MHTSLAEFPSFSLLPAELRIKIWLLSFQQPRLVEIRTGDHPANIEYLANARGNKVSDVRWVTKCPPPSALSVCQESRHLALKVWILRFALLSAGDEVIYINPVLDTIYINVKYVQFLPILLKDIQSFDSSDRGVRSLALGAGNFDLNYLLSFEKKTAIFQGLDILTLVIESKAGGPYGYLDKWDEGCALVVPETKEELKRWEKTVRDARGLLSFEAMEGRPITVDLRVVAIRRGEDARRFEGEENNIILEGPTRPSADFDLMPEVIPPWD